ncbi:MAG: hypothetical protein ACTSSJ_05505 [Candidatus Odinarchaeia archaeon]
MSTEHSFTDEDIINEAIRLIEEAQKKGIILRILGAAAVRVKCPKYEKLHKSFRQLTDIDYVAYWKQERQVDKFLEEQGYKPLRAAVTPGLFVGRRVYNDTTGKGRPHIDVFFDVLDMNHKVDFRKRLEIDYPTISLTDLFLEKTQIVEINEKDIKDIIILLLSHEIGEKDEKDMINGKYIADILSKDWGFWYTVTTNMEKVKKFMDKYTSEGLFTEEEKKRLYYQINKLREMIDKKGKSFGWKLRAKIGTKKLWYNPVGEVERAPHLEEFKTKDL